MTAYTVRELEDKVVLALCEAAGKVLLRPFDAQKDRIFLEQPKNAEFGDLATSFVLRTAKEAKKAPALLAKEIAARFRETLRDFKLDEAVSDVRVDGPGFINIALAPAVIAGVVREILGGERYGAGAKKPGRALLEYVSANPTGPLTVAHGRQAALGDSLSRILRYSGYDVTTEYYNNDEGVQINTLGQSLHLRYRELLGEKIEMPENAYRGGYLVETAKELKKLVDSGKLKLSAAAAERDQACSRFARDEIMKSIVKDLADFGVKFDRVYSQEELGKSGKVEATLEGLGRRGVLYEGEGALWFRSTQYGDDKDRVLKKSDGNYTYLSPDIAYHEDKFKRGFTDLINIWGPDHHGYIPRLKASQEALGHDPSRIRILIAQLVTLYKGKEQVRMSTRAGEFVTLREILDEVGRDAGRFFFCMRKFDSHLDFDLELAKKQTPDNPVFYIQYAHARVSSIKRTQGEQKVEWDRDGANLGLLREPEEVRIMKLVRDFPKTVESASAQLEPCTLIEYLSALAASFHQFYAKHRVVTDDKPRTQARLTLIFALQKVLKTGLDLLGVSAPDSM